MKIEDFFDATRIEHLKVYRMLETTGIWPVGFLPKDIEMSQGWQMLLLSKLADAYLNYALGRKNCWEEVK